MTFINILVQSMFLLRRVQYLVLILFFLTEGLRGGGGGINQKNEKSNFKFNAQRIGRIQKEKKSILAENG